MSNYQAIATVTATLKQRLDGLLADLLPGGVSVGPLATEEPTTSYVNAFLFQVMPNAALRNSDLPTRTSDTLLRQKPRIALDLQYIISFGGPYEGLLPQRMLGLVVSGLHARPFLDEREIANAITAVDGSAVHLADSNLDQELERVKLTPAYLSLDELSKIWSVFFQRPYVLSVVYHASVVLIEADVNPEPPLPVKSTGVFPSAGNSPSVASVFARRGRFDPPAAAPPVPIAADTTLVIRGKRLAATGGVIVRLGKMDLTPIVISDEQLEIDLSTVADLRAGVQALRVLHRVPIRGSTVEHPNVGFESNGVPVTLRPTVLGDAQRVVNATQVRVEVQLQPDVQTDQAVRLLLNPTNGGSPITIEAEARPAATGLVSFPADDILSGNYLVRVVVDNAASILTTQPVTGSEPPKPFNGPKLVVP